MSDWNNTDSKDLFTAITCLTSEKEARCFLRDLLTEKEIVEFSKRWKAAKMLNAKISYTKISKLTGLSSRTVARISKWLNAGMGGYKKMISKTNCNHTQFTSLEKGLR